MRARGVWLIVGALACAAGLDFRVALRSSPPALANRALDSAVALIERTLKPGDVLVHSPLFSLGELKALGGLQASPHVPPAKVLASRRVLVLDRADQPMFGFGPPSEVLPVPESAGLLELRVFEPRGGAGEVLVSTLLDELRATTMRVERPAGAVESRCVTPRGEGGFSCPNEPEWLHVEARTLRIAREDARCVWAHPTTGGVIVLELGSRDPPPSGRRLLLRVSAALVDDAAETTPDGASVETQVVQAGAELGKVVVPNRVGWQQGSFPIQPGAPIELRITAARDGRRHHCVNADVLEVHGDGETR